MYEDQIVINPVTNPYDVVIELTDSDSDSLGGDSPGSQKADPAIKSGYKDNLCTTSQSGEESDLENPLSLTEVQLLVDAILIVDASNPMNDRQPMDEIRYSYVEAHQAPAIPLSTTDEDVELLPTDFETNDRLWMSYEEGALLYYIQNGVVDLADIQAIIPTLNRKPRVIQAVATNIGYFYSAGAISDVQLDALLLHIYKHSDEKYHIYETIKTSLTTHKQQQQQQRKQRYSQLQHHQTFHPHLPLRHTPIHKPSSGPHATSPSSPLQTHHTSNPTPCAPPPPKQPPLWNHTKPQSTFLFKANWRKNGIVVNIAARLPLAPSSLSSSETHGWG